MSYLLSLTRHPLGKRVLIAGSVDRCTGMYGSSVVAREQVISSTTYSLSCNSYAPVNFHKLYPSMAQIDRGIAVCEGMSGLVDHGRFQMTSLPASLRQEREVSLPLSFTVFTYWKSSKCKKSLLFLFRIVHLTVLCWRIWLGSHAEVVCYFFPQVSQA